MSMAMLTIRGLSKYESDVWEHFRVPDNVDRQLCIDNICLELGELELLYPSAPAMQIAIKIWTNAEIDIWKKLQESTELEYNPIENYDRYESYEDTETRNLQNGNTRTDNTQTTLTGSVHDSGSNTPSNNQTTKRYTYGYNSSTKSPAEETEVSPPSKVDTENTRTFNNQQTANTGTVTDAGTDTGTVKHEHTAHLHGNIGVTTAGQMLAEYRETVQFCVIDFITQSFKKRFCLGIY